MKRDYILGAICAASVFMVSCQNDSAHKQGEACLMGNLSVFDELSLTEYALTNPYALRKDALVSQAYDDIDKIKKSGKKLRMQLFHLSPSQVSSDLNGRHLNDPMWSCAYEEKSHFSSCDNLELFHRVNGVPADQIRENAFFIQNASRFIDSLPQNEHLKYYPYKLFYYKREIQEDNNAIRPKKSTIHKEYQELVSQVEVAFGTIMNGWPLVGEGAFATVHMTPEGEIVSENFYAHQIEPTSDVLTENDIISPEEAIEKLQKDNEIDIDDYTIVRREFGYYVEGKDEVQSIIYPSYIFHLDPKRSDSSKIGVFVINAVAGPLGALVDADIQNTENIFEESIDKSTSGNPANEL